MDIIDARGRHSVDVASVVYFRVIARVIREQRQIVGGEIKPRAAASTVNLGRSNVYPMVTSETDERTILYVTATNKSAARRCQRRISSAVAIKSCRASHFPSLRTRAECC